MRLGTAEQHVLQAILNLHPNAYGVSIQDHIASRAGYEPSVASVYAALIRLEAKGFIKSRQGEPTAVRGGRRKLYFEITAPGKMALRDSFRAIDALRGGEAIA